MNLAGIDIYSRSNPVRNLFFVRLIWIPECQFAIEDKMSGQPVVRVRRIMSIAAEARRQSRHHTLVKMMWHVQQAVAGCFGHFESKTYGPSVQVKTWSNPQERTCASCSGHMMGKTEGRWWEQWTGLASDGNLRAPWTGLALIRGG
jgi:hypothetical protein